MAKAKKEKPVVLSESVLEETKQEIIEPVIEETPKVGDEPPAVTLDEIVSVEKDNPKIETVETLVGEIEVLSTHASEPVEIKGEDLTMEQKIINYVESRGEGEFRMNDFLKSLFPAPKFNEPPLWMDNGESKRLRMILDNLQKQGFVTFVSNMHLKLGKFYHDGEGQQTKHYNLNTVQIMAKK